MIGTSLATVAAGALVALAPLVPDTSSPASAPPTSEPAEDDETEQSEAPAEGAEPSPAAEADPAFERELAELAFGLFLSGELEVDAGNFSCTEPPSLDVGEAITCFTLIDDDRVIVAVTELTGTPGVYEFEVVSDHTVTARDSTSTTTATTTPVTTTSVDTSTTALPQPVLVTTAPLSQADIDLLAYGDQQVNQRAQEFIDDNTGTGGPIAAISEYSWDRVTATVTLDITLSPDFANSIDNAAWVTVGDRARVLWHRDSPFRLSDATIKPSLVIIIDGTRYVSDFDLCVQVADQTISMDDWLAEARET